MHYLFMTMSSYGTASSVIKILRKTSNTMRWQVRLQNTRCPSGLQPVKMAFVKYESTELTQRSSAPPLIIMHGLMGSKSNWDYISTKINCITNRTIFAVDVRNHGDSPHTDEMSYPHMAADVKEFMSYMGIKTATLMGMGISSRGVMAAALLYPSLVDQLICIGVTTEGPLDLRVPMFLQTILDIDLEVLRNLTKEEALESVDKQLMENNMQEKPVRQMIQSGLVSSADGGYRWRANVAALLKNFECNLVCFKKPESTTTFDKPTLFIQGKDYPETLKDEWRPIIRKTFPWAEFELVPGAKHKVHWEKPDEVVKIVSAFISNSYECNK